MEAAPDRDDETATIHALQLLDILDTEAEVEFDALVKAASLICEVPISLISLIDVDRQWFKANVGLPNVPETPRDLAFCAHAVLGDALFEVPDASTDPRFHDNPLVTGQPGIKFYAGAPLRLRGGLKVGTLCVIDIKPRLLSDIQRETLVLLSMAAVQALEGRVALRKQVETAKVNARAAFILQHSTDAVIVESAQGNIERWNPAAQRMFGYGSEEIIGQPVTLLMRHEQSLEDSKATLAEEHPTSFESVWQRQDGRPVDVAVTRVPEKDEEGRLTGITKFVREISGQKRAARLLAESESTLRLVTSAMPSMVAYFNPDLTCRFANASYKTGIGKDAPIVGRHIRDILGEELYERSRPYIEGALRGEAQHFDRSMPGPDGTTRHTITQYIPHLADGQLAGFLAQANDVTALKNSEQALLLESAERQRANTALQKVTLDLQEAQRLGRIGSWEWQLASDTTYWSPELYRMSGFPASRRPPNFEERAALYTPDSWARLQSAVEHSIRHREPYAIQLQMIRADGFERWIDTHGEPVLNDEGKVIALRGTAQDITERKLVEDRLRRSQEFLARTGALAGVGGWEVDLRSGKILWSEEVCRIHGCPAGHTPGLDEAIGFYTLASRPRIQKAVELAMAGGPGFDLELRIERTDGQLRWIRTVGTVDFVAGTPVRLVGAFQDVTERHNLAEKLAEQHELLRVTLQSIGDAVITTDTQANITWLNPVAERMTGWLASEAMGRPLDQVFHIVDDQSRRPAENPILACIKHDKVMGLAANTLLISRNGEEFGVQDSASPIRNEQGEMLGAVLVFNDVTEQRRITGEMTYRAKHDALTGLVNRLEFEAQLQRLLTQSLQNGSVHALMFIDLDQFKLVNDACGHTAGDLLLQKVSRLFEDVTRGRDILGRLGGDEFAVLLERCTTDQAQRVAQQICDRMDEFRFVHDGKRFRIGTSIGLVPVDARWTSTSAIMQAADTSCYAAKEAGRNRVHAWFDTDAAMQARSGDMKWATRLEQALDEDRFVLFAQRIFPLTGDKSRLSAEVLVRMLDNDGSLIPPGAFFHAAERFTLASRIDQWVLRHAIDVLKAQPNLDSVACLCINLSGQSVGDRAFHRKAFALLEAAGPSICTKVYFEITETAAITNMADATRFIEQAHALNIGIALDDFGAGAASFGYLKSLKVDKLKIDGQFVRDVIVDPLDNAAVRCFVEVAKVVNMRTVAEFVDSAAVLERITEMGVDYAQGFYLHRPEPIQNVFNIMDRPHVISAVGDDC